MKKYIKPEISIYESEMQSICAGTTTIPVSSDPATEDGCSKRHDNWSLTAPDLWSYEDEDEEE